MPEYLSPGVYVEEVSSGSKPIEGVSTSTTGFAGQTERGPSPPRLVTSWLDYQRWYGGMIDRSRSFTPYCIKGFFDNGGQRAFIARVVSDTAIPASGAIDTTDTATPQRLQVVAVGPGAWGNRIFVRVGAGTQSTPARPSFRLQILYYSDAPPADAATGELAVDPLDLDNLRDPDRREPDAVEDYDNLRIDPLGSNYVLTTVNNASQLVNVSWSDPTAAPAIGDAPTEFTALAGGDDGTVPGAPDYIGDGTQPPNQRTGLAGLETIDEISILCVPDEVHTGLNAAARSTLRGAIINQCERLKDRFAVLQTPQGSTNLTTISTIDTSYAAIYYPFIRVFNPRTQDTLLVPPSGHVAGIYARTDVERGVHKAPANETLRGIINVDLPGNQRPLEAHITKGEHDILNPRGINAIRDFRADGRGIRVWGARTMSSDGEWRYVNVRRLFIFIEESIDEGTQWVVFEPNYESTWARVTRSITNFLTSVWRSGALAGVTQEEAFFVKCDRTTMSQDDIDNGRLICYIGVAPVKPAEFVIFRISQKTVEAGG